MDRNTLYNTCTGTETHNLICFLTVALKKACFHVNSSWDMLAQSVQQTSYWVMIWNSMFSYICTHKLPCSDVNCRRFISAHISPSAHISNSCCVCVCIHPLTFCVIIAALEAYYAFFCRVLSINLLRTRRVPTWLWCEDWVHQTDSQMRR